MLNNGCWLLNIWGAKNDIRGGGAYIWNEVSVITCGGLYLEVYGIVTLLLQYMLNHASEKVLNCFTNH
jgi:hypothetical protein